MVYSKKTFISITIFSLLYLSTYSQSAKAEVKPDTAFLRVLYTFTQKNYTKESLSSRTDTLALDIGATLSEFYDMTAFAKDSLKKHVFQYGRVKSLTIIKNRQIAESVVNTNQLWNGNTISPNSYISFTIYKDRNNKQIYTLDKESDVLDKTIYLHEEIGPQQWAIENDTCRILDYVCNKATTKFRGREYEVYFAPEIPVNEGPWKLYGLPGLILAAKTTDGIFSFQAIGIQKVNDKPINVPDGKDSEVCENLKQYHQFIQSKARTESYIYDKSGDITIAEKFSSKKVILLETEEE